MRKWLAWIGGCILLAGCAANGSVLPGGLGSGAILSQINGDIAKNCEVIASIPGSISIHCMPH